MFLELLVEVYLSVYKKLGAKLSCTPVLKTHQNKIYTIFYHLTVGKMPNKYLTFKSTPVKGAKMVTQCTKNVNSV